MAEDENVIELDEIFSTFNRKDLTAPEVVTFIEETNALHAGIINYVLHVMDSKVIEDVIWHYVNNINYYNSILSLTPFCTIIVYRSLFFTAQENLIQLQAIIDSTTNIDEFSKQTQSLINAFKNLDASYIDDDIIESHFPFYSFLMVHIISKEKKVPNKNYNAPNFRNTVGTVERYFKGFNKVIGNLNNSDYEPFLIRIIEGFINTEMRLYADPEVITINNIFNLAEFDDLEDNKDKKAYNKKIHKRLIGLIKQNKENTTQIINYVLRSRQVADEVDEESNEEETIQKNDVYDLIDDFKRIADDFSRNGLADNKFKYLLEWDSKHTSKIKISTMYSDKNKGE